MKMINSRFTTAGLIITNISIPDVKEALNPL